MNAPDQTTSSNHAGFLTRRAAIIETIPMQSVAVHISTNDIHGEDRFEMPPIVEHPTQACGQGIHISYIYSIPPNFYVSDLMDFAHHHAAPMQPPLRSSPSAGGSTCTDVEYG